MSIDAIDLDNQITAWAEAQFPRPNRDINPVLAHLRREWNEFHAAVSEWSLSRLRGENDPAVREHMFQEAADIRILLTHFVGRLGGNLASETIRKFRDNQTREWGEPDEDGVVEHIREEI